MRNTAGYSKAFGTNDTRGDPSRGSRRFRILSASAILVLAQLMSTAITPVRAETVDAIWKTHRVLFRYSSSNTAYSCGGLGAKLTAILQRVGAHGDVRVTAAGCDEVSGLLTFDVQFRAPVPATAENLYAATAYDSRELLAARLRGERLPQAEDIERFAAQYETISLGRDRTLKLAPSDCDLVRQVMRGFFSRMSVEPTRSQVRCSSALGNFHPPQLTVTALVPAAVSGS